MLFIVNGFNPFCRRYVFNAAITWEGFGRGAFLISGNVSAFVPIGNRRVKQMERAMNFFRIKMEIQNGFLFGLRILPYKGIDLRLVLFIIPIASFSMLGYSC